MNEYSRNNVLTFPQVARESRGVQPGGRRKPRSVAEVVCLEQFRGACTADGNYRRWLKQAAVASTVDLQRTGRAMNAQQARAVAISCALQILQRLLSKA